MVLQVRQEGTPLFAALTSRTSLLEERSGGADLDALATACAARGLAPGSPHVGHEPHVDPRAHQAPGMRTLDLVADAHAAQARDAAVVVDREKGVTGVDADHGADERQLEVVYLQLLGQVLQIAMIVRRYPVSCSEVVVTSIPSETSVVHAGVSLFEPATSTTHRRHEPVSELSLIHISEPTR